MTVLEALNVEVNNITLSEKYLNLVGAVLTDEYSQANHSQVELAKAYCFKAIATQPDWSEDGLSIKYSREYLVKEANRIFDLNDLEDEKIDSIPKISDSTGIW